MNIDWIAVVKYGSTFFGGSLFGSIVTAWNKWGIEKRRLKRQQRAHYIENWRKMIATLPDTGSWSIDHPSCRAILRSEHFLSLEPHLPRELSRKIRSDKTIIVGADFPRIVLTDHVGDLERRWGLV
jgi:hypothetical protein